MIEPIIFDIVAFNVLYVTFFTLRMMLVIKGKKVFASVISMLEVYAYLLGLTFVLENLKNPVNMVAYCLGWGLGVYFGGKMEEYLALGYVTVQAIVTPLDLRIMSELQKQGYGVTSWEADGKSGRRTVIQVLVKRRHEQKVVRLINKFSPNASVISYELKNFKEGFWGNSFI